MKYRQKVKIPVLILGVLSLLATLLSLLPGPYWWVRIFDYPRAQVAILCLTALLLSVLFLRMRPVLLGGWLLLLTAAFVYQSSRIIVYTPLYPRQALDSNRPTSGSSFSLLVSNVLMENRQVDAFMDIVRRHQPDLILINEPDAWWERQLQPLEEEYPFSLKHPMGNTYGMMLYSKLPLRGEEVRFLVQEDVPSVFAQVELPSGGTFDFYGLHPRPPKPGTDTYERDAEILIVGKKVKQRGRPAVVAGDLNDVAWSHTSELFQRYSGLLDLRHGRGLYNTFNAKIPLLRYPLDHVFFSDDFGFISMKRLEGFGSDHFPILISLNLEPNSANVQDEPIRDAEDIKEADRKIRRGT